MWGANRALGIHWGTFQLTDEVRDAPVRELAQALSMAGIPPEDFVAAGRGGLTPSPDRGRDDEGRGFRLDKPFGIAQSSYMKYKGWIYGCWMWADPKRR